MDLKRFTWAYRTNLSKGLLAPKDAIILLLKDGPRKRRDLIKTMQEWRPHAIWSMPPPARRPDGSWPPHRQVEGTGLAYYVYLFNGNYGHVAHDFTGVPMSSVTSRAWWFRTQRANYMLTITGIIRLSELGFQVKLPSK